MANIQKMDVLLDSNVYLSDVLFSRPEFEGLRHYLRTMKTMLILPELVSAEVKKNIHEQAENEVLAIEKLFSKKLGLIEKLPETQEIEESINKAFEKFLYSMPRKQISHRELDLEELVTKAVNETRPFQSKGRGFKDAVIWQSILQYLKNNEKTKLCFISNNHRDFGHDSLHEDLIAELTTLRLEDRLEYFHSITDFLTNHAQSINFIDEKYVRSHIDNYIDSVSGDVHDSELDLDVSTHQVDWNITDYYFSEYVIEGFYVFDEDDKNIRLAVEVTLLFDVDVEGSVEEYDYDPDGGYSYRHNVKEDITGFYTLELVLDIDKDDRESVTITE